MKRCFSGLSLVVICVLVTGTPAMGANTVVVESKTVLPGATGVTIGVFIENDVTLGALTMALEIRTVSGGAFISANTSFDPQGRVNPSGLMDFVNQGFAGEPLDTGYCSQAACCAPPGTYGLLAGSPDSTPGFYTTPDGVFWNGVALLSPFLAVGADGATPSFLLTTDVALAEGQFEIDTGCFAPGSHLVFVDTTIVGQPPIFVVPAFTKGVITIATPNAAPVWDSIGELLNQWGNFPEGDETATLSVSATDPEGDSITITVVDKPPNSSFEQTGDGTGVFTFTPDSAQSLTNGTMLFIATDTMGNADTSVVEWSVNAWSAVRSAGGPIPESYSLDQNYPNPFNAGTVIPFSVGEYGHVRIAVYNVLGTRVATLVDEQLAPGRYTTDWNGTSADGRPVATGIYFYRISTNGHVATRKMLLLK